MVRYRSTLPALVEGGREGQRCTNLQMRTRLRRLALSVVRCEGQDPPAVSPRLATRRSLLSIKAMADINLNLNHRRMDRHGT